MCGKKAEEWHGSASRLEEGLFSGRASPLLLEWFARSARSLPWRRAYDPYEVMVSEFMLQQTQVDTVLPYYEKWMRRFPDLRALAAADESEVKKLWEGLGYYSRAENLLKAARTMVEAGYSLPPKDVEELLRYPGIGPYTAGAVASIGYNESVPAVDGNVERVGARVFDIAEAAGTPALKREVTENFLRMMPEGGARFFNQALMELGALICLPKTPRCTECPLAEFCRSRLAGIQGDRPLPKRRPLAEKVEAWAFLGIDENRCLMRRRPERGLWAGFWEIPWFSAGARNMEEVRNWLTERNIRSEECRGIGTIRFSFTRYRVTARCVVGRLEGGPAVDSMREGEWKFFTLDELGGLTLPAPSRKFLKLFESGLPLEN